MAPLPPGLRSPPSRRDARALVRASRPDLPPDAPAFRAALVLAAGPELRFNIDRIAARCALPRPWVAACVRRLIDNGVWSAGRAECAWTDADDPRFWNDAAVAEGRLQRRTLPDGRVEWAPPGRWEKAYDFVGPQGEPGGPVLYLDAAPRPEAAPVAAEPEAEPDGSIPDDHPAKMEMVPVGEPDTPPPPFRLGAPRIPDGGWRDADAGERAPVGAAAGGPELFPGADWLR